MKLAFYCDTREEYEEIRRAFGKDSEGNELDKDRFMEIVRGMVVRC
jgi:hypothetical protein